MLGIQVVSLCNQTRDFFKMLLKLGCEKPLQMTIILHKESVKGHQLALLDAPYC